MLKMVANIVLGSTKSSTGTRPPHHSAARIDVVLLIRRTVRPKGYASGFDSPAALLGDHFEHPWEGFKGYDYLIPRNVRRRWRPYSRSLLL